MKKATQQTEPLPCDQKWDGPLPASRDGFCTHCHRKIVDFSGWDDDRIRDYFLNSASHTCGRFLVNHCKMYRSPRKRSLIARWVQHLLDLFR